MNTWRVLSLLVMATLVVACEPDSTPNPDPDSGLPDGGDGGMTCGETGMPDDDGDGIANVHEGSGSRDTDGDGTPDVRDLDSDNDTIPDEIERGDGSCADEPLDTDGDGVPDFQDVDSDGNGIRDEIEGDDDADADGLGDWRDPDDDGDGIGDDLEVGPDPIDPADSDGDGVPDYHDRDSDNDGIADDREGAGDVDRDGLHNFRDTDADGDGIPDAEEGEEDCDGDGLANYLDRDSDNDGLSDAVEREIRSDPCLIDTDGDGLTDLVEQAIGTDANDAASGIADDEYFVILPFGEEPIDRELEFETNIKQADVYFLVDTTGSMGGSIRNIQSSLSTFIVPEVADVVPDVQFGVGHFDDVPFGGYGGGSDVAYEDLHEISGDIASIQAAIDTMSAGGGSDGPESDVVAMYCTATGDGVSTPEGSWVDPSPGCLEGRFGYPCFRPYSLPIILVFTDYSFHNGPPDGTTDPYSSLTGMVNWLDAIAVLNDIGAKVLGFAAGSWSDALADLEATSVATGAVTADGTPLTWPLSSDGSGLDFAVVDAIEDLSTQVARDVTTSVEESPIVDDGIDAAEFITDIVPLRSDPEVGIDSMDDDTFYGVQAGTFLTFTVTFQNDIVPEEYEPQVFVARIVVLGDNTVRLDDRRVIILIPPIDIPMG